MKNSTKQNQRKVASEHSKLMSLGLVLGLAVPVITTGLIPSTASAGQRPIGDFLSRQGAFCLQLDASGNIDCGRAVTSGAAVSASCLPDLVELLQCRVQDFEVLSLYGQASGTLANGTPGRAEVTQTGLIGTAFLTGFKGRLYDAFPAEKIVIRATGK